MRIAFLSALALLAAGGASAQDTLPTSNFHAVGFDVDVGDDDAFAQSVTALAQDCDAIALDEDDAVCLREKDNGGQIWIGLRKTKDGFEFATANPGFVGRSAFPVRVEGLQSDPAWEPFEHRLAVTFSSYNIPLLVELTDPREAVRFRDLAEPLDLTLDVTAFTFNPEIFADQAAFEAAQAKLGEDVAYTPDFFIPSGLMGDTPSARATFGGTILEAERMTTTDGASHWRTLVQVQGGGTVNVVFDDIWPELNPKPGQLISGAFWLSAQVPAAGE
ncbi:MAG: hypothetical protein HRT64_09295 [Erythrobacter sp.]|nr:hypothetical protein [Erythrobacter sp.]